MNTLITNPKTSSKPFIVVGALAFLVLGFIWHAYQYFQVIIDDSYIYYRYAENWAQGLGPVFNKGEYVEGYSSTLWLLLLGMSGKLGLTIPLMGRLWGLFFSCLVIPLTWRIACRLGAKGWLAFVAPAMLATSVPFAMWAVGGLEMPLQVFFIALFALLYLQDLDDPQKIPWLSSAIAALLVLTRPESFGYLAVILFHNFVWILKNKGWKEWKTQFFWRLGIALFVVVAFFGWRFFYFGHLLSNATYAKIGGSNGLLSEYSLGQYRKGFFGYLLPFLRSHFLLLAAFSYSALWLLIKRNSLLVWFGFLITLFQVVLILKSGGDWMPLWRFTLPFLPFFYATIVSGISLQVESFSSYKRIFSSFSICFLVVVSLMTAKEVSAASHQRLFLRTLTWGSLFEKTEELKLIVPKGDTIAACAMGVIPYTAIDYPFIDMVGLCDEHIAHKGARAQSLLGVDVDNWERADPEYVFYERKPEWVLVTRRLEVLVQDHMDSGNKSEYDHWVSPKGIIWTIKGTSPTNQVAAQHPGFTQNYDLVKVYVAGPEVDTEAVLLAQQDPSQGFAPGLRRLTPVRATCLYRRTKD